MRPILPPKIFLPIAALAAGIALAGCNSLQSQIDAFNTIVANDLPTACAIVASANATFVTLEATGTIPAKDITIEQQAYAGAQSVCANPSAVTAATALQTLANAYAAIISAKSGAVSATNQPTNPLMNATALAEFKHQLSMRHIDGHRLGLF